MCIPLRIMVNQTIIFMTADSNKTCWVAQVVDAADGRFTLVFYIQIHLHRYADGVQLYKK